MNSRGKINKLPLYAQSTQTNFLVQILCRGTCRINRWAKLNKSYHGQSALRDAPAGEFTATCLMCGYEASDNYNWSM